MQNKLRVLDFFSGIGAFDCALDRLGVDYELVDAVDFDKYAVQSFNAIHGTNFEPQDITEWDKDVGEIDIMWQSSPCQSLSLAGKQEGAEKGSGTRSSLVWEVLRIVEKVKPRVIIWENVKGLTTKKHKHILDEYISDLEKLGYNSYWKVLNSKDFGVPQNRERCYTISIRKDIDKGYEFPDTIPLTKRLKDILETNVDKSYYLSQERLKKIKIWETRQRENGRGFRFDVKNGNDISRTITTSGDRPSSTTYVEEKPVRLGGLYDNEKGRHQAGSIYSGSGVSPTLDTCSGGNRMPYVDEPYIVASRGRNPENPSDRTSGATTEQRFEAHKDGVSNSLTSVAKDNYVAEPVCLIPNNYSHKAGDGMATRKRTISEISGTIAAKLGGNGEMLVAEPRNLKQKLCDELVESGTVRGGEVINHSYTNSEQRKELKDYIETENGVMPTLTTRPDIMGYVENEPVRIRKLTPKECWRLQGFDDSAHDRAEKAGVSNSQRYKQAGNSCTVTVLCALLSQLGISERKWNDMTTEEREQLSQAKQENKK